MPSKQGKLTLSFVATDAVSDSDNVSLLKLQRFNRFAFAVGSLWSRFIDWIDQMLPEAWNVEHDDLHHYFLSEIDDPDIVEDNASIISDSFH